MKDQKDQSPKKPWRSPELKEIKTQDTEALLGPGGDATFTAS
jgi:hypothetical protein